MTEEEKNRELINRKFYKAEQEAGFVESHPRTTPQQQDPAYRLAFRDTDFLLREELRPVRFQLELLKPDMLLDEAGIGSTLVMYGSARIPSPDHVEGCWRRHLARAQGRGRAARSQGALLRRGAQAGRHRQPLRRGGRRQAPVRDLFGRRAFDHGSGQPRRGGGGAESIGLNIVLPHEQAPNGYVTPHLSFQFHYFALRKMHSCCAPVPWRCFRAGSARSTNSSNCSR
jgi:hypothetical protein